MTRAREPVTDDLATTFPPAGAPDDASDPGDSGEHFEAQATRLLPPDRRTPLPERPPRPATVPPAQRMRAPTPAPPMRMRHPTPGPLQTPPPGIVYDRGGRGAAPGIAASIAMPPPPAMQATPVVVKVPSLVSPPPMPAAVPQTMPLPAQPMAAPLPPGLLPSSLAQASLPPSLAQASLPPLVQASLPPLVQASLPPPLRPAALPPGMMPAAPPAIMAAAPLVPPAPGWPVPGQPPGGAPPTMHALYERRQRHGSQLRVRRRRSSVQPWMLVIGALIMALLAFAVTRACIHTATRSVSESR